MDDLVQFLRDRYDEAEADARARRGIFPSPGVNDDGAVWLHVRPGGNAAIVWYRHPTEGWDDMAKLRNWADTNRGWTKERVLADVAAKRRVVDAYAEVAGNDIDEPREYAYGWANGLGLAVRSLALEHADHPEYKETWRP